MYANKFTINNINYRYRNDVIYDCNTYINNFFNNISNYFDITFLNLNLKSLLFYILTFLESGRLFEIKHIYSGNKNQEKLINVVLQFEEKINSEINLNIKTKIPQI